MLKDLVLSREFAVGRVPFARMRTVERAGPHGEAEERGPAEQARLDAARAAMKGLDPALFVAMLGLEGSLAALPTAELRRLVAAAQWADVVDMLSSVGVRLG